MITNINISKIYYFCINNIMTEKLTDHYMITEYNKVFKHFYHTEKNKKVIQKFAA